MSPHGVPPTPKYPCNNLDDDNDHTKSQFDEKVPSDKKIVKLLGPSLPTVTPSPLLRLVLKTNTTRTIDLRIQHISSIADYTIDRCAPARIAYSLLFFH